MKRIIMTAVVALGIAGGVSFAADNQESEKDWCLMGISNKCPGTMTIDLIDKIKRINMAISKGTTVYTPAEIEHFKNMLEDTAQAEDSLIRPR